MTEHPMTDYFKTMLQDEPSAPVEPWVPMWSATYHLDGTITKVDHQTGVVTLYGKTPENVAYKITRPAAMDIVPHGTPDFLDFDWDAYAAQVSAPVQIEPQPCDTCTDAQRCSRISQCLRYRCEFGTVDKP